MAKEKSNNLDGTLKRVHTEVSDSSSSDEEFMINTNKKKYRVTSGDTWPRFLVIESCDDGALKKLSPFAIQKGIQGLAGEPKTVKKLRNGSLLVECCTHNHSKCLLKSKLLCNIPIKVSVHASLNTSKGVIRSRDLEGVSEEEICENLSSQGVSAVRRIKVRRNNELVPTNTFILTFDRPVLPDCIKAGYLKIAVTPFVPNPLRCFKCQKYGHGQNTCRGKLTCARCGQFDHESKTCRLDMVCINCKGNHFAYSRECPRWKFEKQVQHIKVNKNLSFTEARKFVENTAPVAVGISYAAVAKVSTTSTSVQTDLTWPNDANRCSKIAVTEKVKKQSTKSSKTLSSKSTQVSDSVNLSKSIDAVQPASKPASAKTTKSPKKDGSSGRLKKSEQQILPISNVFQALDDLDEMEISSQSHTHKKNPPPKSKITPILFRDDK